MTQDGIYTGHPDSFEIDVAPADGANAQTIGQLPDDKMFLVKQIIIEYAEAGSVDTTFTLHDDLDGTAAGNLSDALKTFRDVAPDERLSYDGLHMRPFQEDLMVNPDGNQDDTYSIYVEGKVVESAAHNSA